eukprot:1140533-Rhodomonas_salina.2
MKGRHGGRIERHFRSRALAAESAARYATCTCVCFETLGTDLVHGVSAEGQRGSVPKRQVNYLSGANARAGGMANSLRTRCLRLT